MRRADRLFEILQRLRGGRLRTARALAEALEVSTRTIWRDIAELQAQGVPIEGERGVGYLLRDTFFLPPLALTQQEAEALSWGVQLVEGLGDEALAQAARELAVKIAAVSPEGRSTDLQGLKVFAAPNARAAKGLLAVIRQSVREKHKLAIHYRDAQGQQSTRIVRPLSLEFWGHVWTLTTWCELRGDFRVFRCDRLDSCQALPDRFRDEAGKRFADFLAHIEEKTPHDRHD